MIDERLYCSLLGGEDFDIAPKVFKKYSGINFSKGYQSRADILPVPTIENLRRYRLQSSSSRSGVQLISSQP